MSESGSSTVTNVKWRHVIICRLLRRWGLYNFRLPFRAGSSMSALYFIQVMGFSYRLVLHTGDDGYSVLHCYNLIGSSSGMPADHLWRVDGVWHKHTRKFCRDLLQQLDQLIATS